MSSYLNGFLGQINGLLVTIVNAPFALSSKLFG